jgi:hypothetical protein
MPQGEGRRVCRCLNASRSGQILCCTQALAAWAALGPAQPTRAVVAGYSVGELAAWGWVGDQQPQAGRFEFVMVAILVHGPSRSTA